MHVCLDMTGQHRRSMLGHAAFVHSDAHKTSASFHSRIVVVRLVASNPNTRISCAPLAAAVL
jgi:hypothetical protein